MFGVYTKTPWTSTDGYEREADAIVCSLRSQSNQTPNVYLIKHACSKRTGSANGPSFGDRATASVSGYISCQSSRLFNQFGCQGNALCGGLTQGIIRELVERL